MKEAVTHFQCAAGVTTYLEVSTVVMATSTPLVNMPSRTRDSSCLKMEDSSIMKQELSDLVSFVFLDGREKQCASP